MKGNLDHFINPRDSNENICKPDEFLFYFDMTTCLNPLVSLTGCTAICVESCPTTFFEIESRKGDNNNFGDDLKCKINDTKESIIQKLPDYFDYSQPKCARFYFPSNDGRCFYMEIFFLY